MQKPDQRKLLYANSIRHVSPDMHVGDHQSQWQSRCVFFGNQVSNLNILILATTS